MFKCQTCDKRYSSKKSLNLHMNIHDELKTLKCDICLKFFVSKSLLNRHYRTHTGKKPFACKACNKTFARKDHLVRHQATHSEVRSFKCSICPEGRYFKTKDCLNKHMVYHYEPKFACSHCDYKPYTSSDLNKHKLLHDKNKNEM